MNCPACKVKLDRKIKLDRIQYEGLNIRHCNDCGGHLLTVSRLNSIQTRRRQTENDLLDEVVDEGTDTTEKLRCSACLRMMQKHRKKIGSLKFFIDRCRDCDHIWLDKGELAKLQVAFEYSEKGEEAERFRQRLANMSPQEKTAFQRRVDSLPEEHISEEIAFGLLFDFWLNPLRRR